MRGELGVSERRACRVLGQHRTTQRHVPKGKADEDRLVEDMIELAREYGPGLLLCCEMLVGRSTTNVPIGEAKHSPVGQRLNAYGGVRG